MLRPWDALDRPVGALFEAARQSKADGIKSWAKNTALSEKVCPNVEGNWSPSTCILWHGTIILYFGLKPPRGLVCPHGSSLPSFC